MKLVQYLMGKEDNYIPIAILVIGIREMRESIYER